MKERVSEQGNSQWVTQAMCREEWAERSIQSSREGKLEREKLSDPKNPNYLTALCQELWGSRAGE